MKRSYGTSHRINLKHFMLKPAIEPKPINSRRIIKDMKPDTEYTDETIMPFGKHKGLALKDVPGSWLIWAYENIPNLAPGLKQHITDRLPILRREVIAAKRSDKYERR